VGPSIRSNHNENTLLLKEGELGHPEVAVPVIFIELFLTHANSVQLKLLIGDFSVIFGTNLGVWPNFEG
jgi:hypothetical protein